MGGMMNPKMAQMGLLGAQMMQNKDNPMSLGGLLSSPMFLQTMMMPGKDEQGQMPVDQGGQAMPPAPPPPPAPAGLTDKDLMATGRPMVPIGGPEQEAMRRAYLEEMARLQGTGAPY